MSCRRIQVSTRFCTRVLKEPDKAVIDHYQAVCMLNTELEAERSLNGHQDALQPHIP